MNMILILIFSLLKLYLVKRIPLFLHTKKVSSNYNSFMLNIMLTQLTMLYKVFKEVLYWLKNFILLH